MIASSILSPAMRRELAYTMPPSEITPTSLVPPPMSRTMEPVGSPIGRGRPPARGVANGGLTDRAPFHLGGAARHANDDARRRLEQALLVYLADEVFEHFAGHGEVGDHAVLHRAGRPDRARGAADHAPGLGAHPQHPAAAA